MARRILRWLGIATLLIGYSLLAHYTNKSAHNGNLGALVAIAPVALLALVLAWRSPQRSLMLGMFVLACAALWAGWSVFTNFLTLPLVALMFIVEYWVRRRVLPDMQHAHILDAIRAFRDNAARPADRQSQS